MVGKSVGSEIAIYRRWVKERRVGVWLCGKGIRENVFDE